MASLAHLLMILTDTGNSGQDTGLGGVWRDYHGDLSPCKD